MRLARITLDVLLPDDLDAVTFGELVVDHVALYAKDDEGAVHTVVPFDSSIIETRVVVTP